MVADLHVADSVETEAAVKGLLGQWIIYNGRLTIIANIAEGGIDNAVRGKGIVGRQDGEDGAALAEGQFVTALLVGDDYGVAIGDGNVAQSLLALVLQAIAVAVNEDRAGDRRE